MNGFALSIGLKRRLTATRKWVIEFLKTKTKVITLTNHNARRHSNEAIRTRSKYM